MREIYDRFLAKFPLLFGYWKKYADLEFSIAGTEAAEMVPTYLLFQLHQLTSVRFTNEALLASQTQPTYGQTTAPSKSRPVMTPMSFESKYKELLSFP
jgi:hypothetical protein